MHTLIPIRSANLGNARMEGYNLNLIDNLNKENYYAPTKSCG